MTNNVKSYVSFRQTVGFSALYWAASQVRPTLLVLFAWLKHRLAL